MLIDGKAIAEEIRCELKTEISNLSGRSPCLSVILVGDHPASQIYIKRKVQACKECGILSLQKRLPASTSQEALLEEIETLNNDLSVDGILVQLPLPPHIDTSTVLHAIDPEKDVDGFHPMNIGKMLAGETDGFFPCTPFGIQILLQRSGIETAGMNALVIGRSNIVGKPMAALLMQNTPGGNATVTVAHSRTRNLKEIAQRADLIIVAMGKPLFLTEEMVKEGAVVIDVGINKIEDPTTSRGYRLVGDADFEHLEKKCAFITPVPGGVGPMTIAMLLSNTWKSYKQREHLL